MTVRTLDRHLTAWRIGDPTGRFPIWSGDGAALTEGRWHRKGEKVIYASEHYGTAMLEKLAHWNGILPPNQHFLEVSIPSGTSYEVVTKDSLKGWDAPAGRASRKFGSVWIREKRTCILIVPSFVSREENNVLVHPGHEEFPKIDPGLEKPIRWDARLHHVRKAV